ncbi:MAG: family transposase [Dactylosporangium sp.]|nr:family transposase [Dactylosporangium sp.]
MMYPLVGDLAADGIPVAVTCRVLGFTPQAFYAWRKDPVSQRDWDDAHLINAALDIHHDDPAFGYRFNQTGGSPGHLSAERCVDHVERGPLRR